MDDLMPLHAEMLEKASITCAEAFMDDGYTAYSIPDVRKRAYLRYGCEYYLRLSLLGGATMRTTSPACEGVAVWQDSLSKEPLSAWLQARPWLPFRCGLTYIVREFRLNRQIENFKKRYAPKHHIYLALLAVQPRSQGRGYGSRMLKVLGEDLDRLKLPCYLETQNLKNVSMYERFGYKLVGEAIAPGANLPLYFMLRE
jgi:GNAT superfamily N-acetyltransferase